MCNFEHLRQHAGARTVVLTPKKAPAAARRYKNNGFNEKKTVFKNVSKTGRNELEIYVSHFLGASANDFDNEMLPNA